MPHDLQHSASIFYTTDYWFPSSWISTYAHNWSRLVFQARQSRTKEWSTQTRNKVVIEPDMHGVKDAHLGLINQALWCIIHNGSDGGRSDFLVPVTLGVSLVLEHKPCEGASPVNGLVGYDIIAIIVIPSWRWEVKEVLAHIYETVVFKPPIL